MGDPDLDIRGGGYPDPDIKGRGPGLKNFFSAFRASFWSRNKAGGGGGGGGGGWIPWNRHCNRLLPMNPNLVTVSWKKTILHRKASFKEWKRVNNPAESTLASVHMRKIWPLWYGNWFAQLPENQPLDVATQIWVVLLIGWSKFPTRHEQSEALARWNLELRSSFRRLFAKKQVVASQNVFWQGKYPPRSPWYSALSNNW